MTIRWMFHATAMGPDYEDILQPLQLLLGARVLHCQAVDTPGIERRGGMLWIADNSIEIGEPYGTTSPVHRFIERFGGGMSSIAVQVDDLDEALARAESFGVRLASRPMSGVAFTRPADTAGLLFEWSAIHQEDDPRWGVEPPPIAPSVLDPELFAFVGAVVPDPPVTARFLGDMLDTEWSILDVNGSSASPQSTVTLGDCTLALFALAPVWETESIWGCRCDRPRFLTMGVTVRDRDNAEAALTTAGYKISSVLGDGSSVIHGQDLPFPIVVARSLLPGDPRER